MSKSRNQKLLDAARLIHENCKEHISKNKCHKYVQEESDDTDQMKKKTWIEFKETGLLWWINMILHTFGWVIVLEIDKDTKELLEVYPARVKYRGFSEQCNTKGYQSISKYMAENAKELEKECY